MTQATQQATLLGGRLLGQPLDVRILKHALVPNLPLALPSLDTPTPTSQSRLDHRLRKHR